MDAETQDVIATIYVHKENYKNVYPWLAELKAKGLDPSHIVVDGEISVMRAIRENWPNIVIQRCLYHIQREGMRWLRTYPKTLAGRELRLLLGTLCTVRIIKERDEFINAFHLWVKTHNEFIKTLPSSCVAYKDLKRTVSLIKNALPNMFHYLHEPNISSTTNLIEGLYSRLKSDYSRHRGLTEQNKRQYLKWYCYFNNKKVGLQYCG
jgi:transposase-like protein